VTSLRHAWPDLKGTKDEIGFAIAATKDYARISAFVCEHLSCCKQHVYVLQTKPGAALPVTILGEQATTSATNTSLFILRVRYEVVLRDPLEETTIDFLWPILVEMQPDFNCALLRLVVLEKGVSQYFDRNCYVPGRSIDEKDVVSEVEAWSAGRVDLHKGIKALWDTGFMDSPTAKLQKALSMASETMHEELGIREHNPELYEQILESTLLSALFSVTDEKHGISVFSAQPSLGYLVFPRYCAKGSTDFVISEILKHNQ
jgi:hypothetical protein